MKRLKALLGAAVTAIVLAGPASAQPTPIDVAANATWMHDTAKVRFPPEIDGFRRSRVQDFGDQRLDVGATYFEESSGTTATIYLFRVAEPDVSLWHDRALISIRPHDLLGTPDHSSAVTAAFAPPHSANASGLLTVLPLSGRSMRSTALAVFPQGRWLIKVRMSSQGLDPAQLGARVAPFLAALPIDPFVPAAPEAAAPAAAAMAPCDEGVTFASATRAARAKSAVMLALAMNEAAADAVRDALPALRADKTPGQAPAPLCRDAASQPGYGVYRRIGVADQYLIGFGDAGISAAIGKDRVVQSLGDPASENFWVVFANPYKTSFYRGFEALPAPAQVIAVIDGEQALSSVERRDGKANIEVAPD